jgi:cytochrome c oxidase assembly protein subunit 11
MSTARPTHKRLLVKLGLVVLAMFGFGFALVPIYDVICDITGLNGKTGALSAKQAEGMTVDEIRTITLEFLANLNQGLDWEFRPGVRKMQVHPGKLYSVSYHARNLTGHQMVGQAVPSVTPNTAAAYFSKTECFCFTQQSLAAGEGRDMPLTFIVNPDLPERIKTISLSYTFFDVTQTAKR